MTYIRKVIGVIPPCPCPNGEGSDSSTEQVSEAVAQATHSLQRELTNLGESNTKKFGSKLKRKVIGKTYDGPKGSNTPPKMDADTPVVGKENAFARGDHQHPHDTTKADVTALETERNRAMDAEAALGNRITTNSNAINAEKQRAQLKEQLLQQNINTESQRAQEAEQQLRALYQALTETETIPVSELPATGEVNKIYRVAGDGNYSDYMWNGTEWVLMATFDNDIDDEPTLGSNNLVKSGGVAGMYGHYEENPEFLYVMTDMKQRLFLALRKDGQVMFGAGVPYQVKEYVDAKIAEILGDDDLTEKIDSLKEIVAFLENFKNSDTLKQLLGAKVDKEEGKSLINKDYADGITYVENPEYVYALIDAVGHFILGVTVEGKIRTWKGGEYDPSDISWMEEWFEEYNDIENRSEITLTENNKMLGWRDSIGVWHEQKIKIEYELLFSNSAIGRLIQSLMDAGFNPSDNSNKTILWLGTSIPGGWAYPVQIEGQTVNNAYPDMVGVLLRCNVINKAMGSSRIACGWRSNVTENNPYGIPQGGSGEGFRRSLLHTIAEKQEIIDNFDAYKAAYNWTVDTLSESEKRIMLNSCSYESILIPYLDGTYDAPDIIVIDHGHNDSYTNDTDKGTLDNRTDRLTFYGGYNIVVDLIRRYNRNIKIVQVAHFISGTEYEQLIESQKAIAKKNGVIFCPLYDIDGWDAEGQIKTRGRWNYSTPYSSYNWATWEDNVLDSDAFMSVKAYHLPDGVHPHSDMSGQQNKELAYAIAGWLKSVFGFIK